MADEQTTLPPFVIPGEYDWRPAREAWKGPLSHPYDGCTAYTRIMPNGERRIYPSKEAADAAE